MSTTRADLRFLMPLRAGETVVIIGGDTDLATTLVGEKLLVTKMLPPDGTGSDDEAVTVRVVPGQPLPYLPASADHVLAPFFTPAFREWFPEGLAQLLKPGGWMLLGLNHYESLRRLRFRAGRDSPDIVRMQWSLPACVRALHRAGLTVVKCYGVDSHLRHPQFLVPLGNNNAVRYFFEQIYTPHTRPASVARWLAPLFIAAGLHSALFGSVAVVARRNGKK